MRKPKKCPYCLTEMYQDEHDTWFCPDCILEDIDAAFLNPNTDDPGELKKPYILKPPTKQISIRLAVSDLELARKLARRKGIPKYQTYMKTLLHDALIKEAQESSEYT